MASAPASVFAQRGAAGGVAFITGLGMAAGLATDVLVASRLGATGASDALILGLTIPLVLETIFREGSRFSLVPVMMPAHADPATEVVDLSALVNVACAAGLVILLVMGLAAPQLVRVVGPGLAEAQARIAVDVLRMAMPLVVASMVANCFAAYLSARSHFMSAAFRYLVISLTVLFGAGFVQSKDVFITAFSSSMVLGYLLYLALLWRITCKLGWRYNFRRWPSLLELRMIVGQVGWPMGGFLAGQLMRVVERGLASTVAPGGVALYYFAFRIFNAVRNLIGMSLATVGLPELARRHVSDDPRSFRKAIVTSLVLALLVLVPVCAGLFIGAQPLVDWLFGRGVFSSADGAATASVLKVLTVALLFFGLSPILMSALYARRQQKLVFFVMLSTAAINLLLALLLAEEHGLEGIALAFVVAAMFSVTLTAYTGFRGPSRRRLGTE